VFGSATVTRLLERAVKVARALPEESQDDIARIILELSGADDEAPIPLTREEQAAISASKAAAARGEFATDEEVRAVWAKHGL
jgi:predicted transcriptional regulator